MINTIQNEFLEIRVSNLGAELQNIININNGLEYLWQGNPAHWRRRAPVLFPIVGALKDGFFVVNGNQYSMGQHGFARDSEFDLTSTTKNSLTYTLRSNEEMLRKYPFHFSLSIQYTLEANQLFIKYLVENTDAKELLFSIGAHPAFNCPLFSDEKRSDYSLVFEKQETIRRQLIESGTRTRETRSVLENASILPISDDLFEEDALIFEGLQSNAITLQKREKPILTMNFNGFPYFGIWSKSATSPFVCLEPWHGITDHVDHNNNYEQKEGIIRLESGKSFQSKYELIFH